MLRGKEGQIMSSFGTGGWDTRQVLIAQITGRIKNIEKDIEYYQSIRTESTEQVIEDIVNSYKDDLKELRIAYARAKKF